MNTVEPIRNLNLILDIESYLREKNKRDYVLFMFGLYSGLRISDILPLKVRDVKEAKYLSIREKKTSDILPPPTLRLRGGGFSVEQPNSHSIIKSFLINRANPMCPMV